MWERSFYGMKYLLVLYLVQHHLFSDGDIRILGAYSTGLCHATVGWYCLGSYLGQTRSVQLGALFLVAGHCAMAFEGLQRR